MDHPTQRKIIHNNSNHYFVVPISSKNQKLPSLSNKPSWINVDEELKVEKIYSHKSDIRLPKKEFTHFICIPMNYSQLIDSFTSFKYEIIYNVDEMLEKSFVNLNRIHITIVMLKLDDEDKLAKAKKLIESLKPKINAIMYNYQEKEFRIEGIGSFKGNNRIVFAKLDDSFVKGPLEEITDIIVSSFKDKGIIDDDDKAFVKKNGRYIILQPHITIMNSSKSNSQNLQSIIDKYKDLKFGNFKLTKIHLSKRFEASSEEFYKCESEIAILKLD